MPEGEITLPTKGWLCLQETYLALNSSKCGRSGIEDRKHSDSPNMVNLWFVRHLIRCNCPAKNNLLFVWRDQETVFLLLWTMPIVTRIIHKIIHFYFIFELWDTIFWSVNIIEIPELSVGLYLRSKVNNLTKKTWKNQVSSSGEPIRTTDLRVMSPTSYHCSTPHRN